MPTETKPKVIVAVHGVGDQVMSETVQKVINRFCRYHGETMGAPLGKIKNLSVQKNPYERKIASGQTNSSECLCKPFKMSDLGYDGELGKLSFVEVHWADLARAVDENRFLLEEPKSWSKTIVERLPKRYKEAAQLTPKEFGAVRLLLREMLETLRTLENLFKVAALAGLFKFDLGVVLNAYLGDVQVVTEFDDVRYKILGRFKSVMENLPNDFDIYIVAHSEGTVVTLLSLLEEMSSPEAHDWLNQVRGLMTIGSPLDKHLLLWRELFEPQGKPLTQKWKPSRQIEWRNYYDNGDPIGFELEGLRRWLCDNDWNAFNFKGTEDLNETEENKSAKSVYGRCRDQVKKKLAPPIHDLGFTRYYFPGKAHNDYWGDNQVFGHFIQTVVYQNEIETGGADEKDKYMPKEAKLGKKPSGSESSNPKKNKPDYSNPPSTKGRAWLISYCAPYLMLMALMLIGVYVLYKAVKGSLAGEDAKTLGRLLESSQHESAFDVLKSVFGISSLLAGMTVLARIPRLTIAWHWRLLGGPICFALGALGYFVTTQTDRDFLGASLYQALSTIGPEIGVRLPQNPIIGATWGMIVVALIVVVLSWLAEKSFPKWGLRTLVIFGGVAMAMILFGAISDHANQGPLWPVLLATAFALYLWQAVILTFDLVFVWHRYIRHWRELGFSKWKPIRAQNST
jgi:hypothetical protein